MSKKTAIWIGLFVSSGIGSYLPAIWGANMFSVSSIIGSAIGGILGIWLGFKIGE